MKPYLDRHGLDIVARAVVSGMRGLGRERDRTADDIAAFMRGSLEASGAPGFQRVAHKRAKPLYRLRMRYGDAGLVQLCARVRKHLAAFAADKEATDD